MLFFIDRIVYSSRPVQMDTGNEPHTLSDDSIILRALTHWDTDAFFELYSQIRVYDDFGEFPVRRNDTRESLATRIVSICEMIWTIRLANSPAIIGDCALHHWDKENHEMEFVGSLFPKYWGHGIMAAAFQLVTAFAKSEYGVKTIKYTTSTANHRAIRFAEKMGFDNIRLSQHTISMKKKL